MFDKKWIRTIIIPGNNNNMSPMTTNIGGHQNAHKYSTIENKGFQMTPLSIYVHIGEICTIFLEYGLIRPFNTIFFNLGERTQIEPEANSK